jgi:hypothetical protein
MGNPFAEMVVSVAEVTCLVAPEGVCSALKSTGRRRGVGAAVGLWSIGTGVTGLTSTCSLREVKVKVKETKAEVGLGGQHREDRRAPILVREGGDEVWVPASSGIGGP